MQEKITEMLKKRGHSNPQKGSQVIQMSIPISDPTIEARLRLTKEFFTKLGYGFIFIDQNIGPKRILMTKPQVPVMDEGVERRTWMSLEEERQILQRSDVQQFLREVNVEVIAHRHADTSFVISPTTDYQKKGFSDVRSRNP